MLLGEAKWTRREKAPALLRSLERKALAVPGIADERTYVVCARERLEDVPDGVFAVTAEEIFGD